MDIMTTSQFRKLRKLIGAMEDEALKEGININSQEFKMLIDEAIIRSGHQPNDYYEMENKPPDNTMKIEGAEQIKGDVGEKGDPGHTPTKEEVAEVVEAKFQEWKDKLKGEKGDTVVGPPGPPGPEGREGRPGKRGISAIALRGKQGEPGKDADESRVEKLEDYMRRVAKTIINLTKKDE